MNAVLKPTASGGRVECIIPTTESQREVWLGATMSAEASMAYNESVVLRLRGALDCDAMASAVARLLERHQALRATISPGRHLHAGQPPRREPPGPAGPERGSRRKRAQRRCATPMAMRCARLSRSNTARCSGPCCTALAMPSTNS
jgi:hypothetical protein